MGSDHDIRWCARVQGYRCRRCGLITGREAYEAAAAEGADPSALAGARRWESEPCSPRLVMGLLDPTTEAR